MIASEARGAWKELERHLRPYLARRVASAADIDDLLQDIFVRLHQSVATLRDEDRFGGWVYRVAHSAVVDRARQNARTPHFTADDSAELSAVAEAQDPLRSELEECVALFVSRLSSPYREAVTLTELQGLTHKEAAEMLGVSLSGLKSRVQRGRDKIRRMFEECCQISVDCRGRVIECEPRHATLAPPDCHDPALSPPVCQDRALPSSATTAPTAPARAGRRAGRGG
jgi:RNA polymerase sigma-70 factor, ECF subfamily